MLVTVHHVDVTQRAYEAQADRVGPLAPDVPRVAERQDPQRPHHLVAIGLAEGHERGRHRFGHRPGELERVAFGAAYDARAAEERWHQVHDTHAYFKTSSS